MMLMIENLNVSYGVIPVLHDVKLEIGEGELVALLGANGAGKTTLLNAISGLMRGTSGTISFQGSNIENTPPQKIVQAGISQIPEGRKIFPYLNVKENLFMGASTRKAWGFRHKMFDEVSEIFPILKERADQRASLMSGGEQQMLVIARGLMARPKLLMIDEPSLGLSPALQDLIYEAIEALPKKGITVLLSEQNAQIALEISDRGYVMQDGEVVMAGTSKELLESDLIKKAYMGV
jgi:branched-chain amino acid transport system ATP-binding protein